MSGDKGQHIQEDLAKLAEDFDHLAGDIRAEAEHLAEDAAGAQFVAATDIVESLGTGLEYGRRLGDVWAQQWQTGVEDYRQIAKALRASSSPESALAALRDHVARRITHVNRGFQSCFELAVEEQSRLAELHRSLWDMFRRAA